MPHAIERAVYVPLADPRTADPRDELEIIGISRDATATDVLDRPVTICGAREPGAS